jgi:hypothetical protein
MKLKFVEWFGSQQHRRLEPRDREGEDAAGGFVSPHAGSRSADAGRQVRHSGEATYIALLEEILLCTVCGWGGGGLASLARRLTTAPAIIVAAPIWKKNEIYKSGSRAEAGDSSDIKKAVNEVDMRVDRGGEEKRREEVKRERKGRRVSRRETSNITSTLKKVPPPAPLPTASHPTRGEWTCSEPPLWKVSNKGLSPSLALYGHG